MIPFFKITKAKVPNLYYIENCLQQSCHHSLGFFHKRKNSISTFFQLAINLIKIVFKKFRKQIATVAFINLGVYLARIFFSGLDLQKRKRPEH